MDTKQKVLNIDESLENEIKEENDLTEEQIAERKRILTEAAIKAVRKNPKQFIKMMKLHKYFGEDNRETAILNMLNSGLGRKGRRLLAKKMMVNWKEFLEMEDAVVDMHIEDISSGTLESWLERKKNFYINDKISKRERFISEIMVDDRIHYEDAEKEYDELFICN